MKRKLVQVFLLPIIVLTAGSPVFAGANGQITSPLTGSTINYCPTLIVARAQDPSGVNNVRFYAYYDGDYHYASVDYTGTDIGGGWFEFSGSWDCTSAVANPQTVKVRIDVYPNVGSPLIEEDEQDNITLSRSPAAAITSPANPPTTEINNCPQLVQATVNHPNGADYVTFYVWYDSYWHYFGRDYSAPFSASWDCNEASDQAGVRVSIDVYITGIGLAQEVDSQGDFNLNKSPAATITSPTNPPTTDITVCPQLVEAAVNHPNGADYVTFYVWYDSYWHYFGRDYSAPFTASWDCNEASDQAGVQFRIDVYITGIGLTQEADIAGDFNLSKTLTATITSPTNPPTTDITICPQLVEATVNHPNGADYVTFYVWYDSGWHYIDRDYSAPYTASWDCSAASDQAGIQFKIDVYVTGIGLTQEADIAGDFNLSKTLTATITSPTNPPTTEITFCPQEIQAAVNHPNGADYVTFYVWYDSGWNYIGRDYSAPYSASWDCSAISNQAGVQFRIDVYVTGIGLTQDADIAGDFDLNKTPAGAITSPTNPPTTDINSCPQEIQVTINHPNGADYVTFYAWYDSGWHYISRDYSAPFSASWDCDEVSNQSGVRIRIDVYVTGLGLTEEADVAGEFNLEAYLMEKVCGTDGSCWGDTSIQPAGSTLPLAVEIFGGGGVRASGATVTFAITQSPGGSPSLTPSNGIAVTDSGGRATVTLNTSSVTGQYQVQATASASGSPATFTINTVPSNMLDNTGGVFDNSGAFQGVGNVIEDVFVPKAGEEAVLNPVWNNQGTQIAAAMIAPAAGNCAAGANTSWNIYVYTISNGACTRVTNDDMHVAPASKASFDSSGAWILFAGKEMEATCTYAGNHWCTVENQELWKVHADGSDKDRTQIQLVDLSYQVSKNWNYNWNDPDWKSCGCTATLGGNVVKFRTSDLSTDSSNLLTNFYVGDIELGFRPMFNGTCTKIVFAAMNFTQYGGWIYSPTNIYILTDVEAARSNPVTSLSDPLLTQITDDADTMGAYFFPAWTTDEQSVTYSLDLSKKFHLNHFYSADVVDAVFTSKNFRNYIDYVADPSLAIPKLALGGNSWNEWGMAQCGPTCPTGRPFVFISQTTSDAGALKLLTLKDEATIQSGGGVLFNNGLVTAVFPPGAVWADQTKVQVSTPTTTPAEDGAITKLVFSGVARNFWPDGTTFASNIRLIFHYCDRDGGVGDGYLDTIQDDTCSGGTSPSNTTISENALYVYYWNDFSSQWNKYGGYVDTTNNYIVIETNHFSTYGVFGVRQGFAAPAAFTPLAVSNLHAYPNPWRMGDSASITFNADAVTSNSPLTVEILIVDMTGEEVFQGIAANVDPAAAPSQDPNGGIAIFQWNLTNMSGKRVSSGTYMYRIRISDNIATVERKGKIAVIK